MEHPSMLNEYLLALFSILLGALLILKFIFSTYDLMKNKE